MAERVDYDRVWDEVYGDLQDVGPTHRHMIRLMGSLLEDCQYRSVLEVGVGFGHNLPLLTNGRTLECVAGADVSERAVEHVRSRFDGDFYTLDVTTGRLPDRYELVCSALLLEHLKDDEGALANLRAMSSGYLLVTTMGGDFERYVPWERQVGHVRNYRRGELERKLRAAGFEPLQTIYWGWPFFSPIARRLQNRMTLTNELSAVSKLIARLLYRVYFLNSSRRGDLVLALARVI